MIRNAPIELSMDAGGPGLVAEPPRDHHRRAEIVGFVPEGIADMEANPYLQPFTCGGTAGRVLHGDGAAHRVSCGRKGDHEPVAKPLHFLSTVLFGSVPQKTVVRLEDTLRLLVARSLQ